MGAKLQLMTISMKNALAYKLSFILWSITFFLTITIDWFLWKAVYAHTGVEVIRGFTFSGLITYLILSMITMSVIYNHTDRWLYSSVRHGTLDVWLLNPLTIFSNKLWQSFGYIIFSFFIQSLPLIIVVGLVFKLQFTGITNLILFIVSVSLAAILNYTFNFIFGLSAFWIKKYSGIQMLKNGLVSILSGFLFPLAFFPEAFQTISNFLPFQYMIYVPVQIYLGGIQGTDAVWALVIQAAWIILFFILVQIIWKRALKKFAGVGT